MSISAPVTAPATKPLDLHERRLEAAALILHAQDCDGRCPAGPIDSDFDKARELLAAHATDGDTVISKWIDSTDLATNMTRAFDRIAAQHEQDMERYRSGLLRVHDYDMTIFGGFYCLACTPAGDCNPEELVAWPCPTLRDGGFTDRMAEQHIIDAENETLRSVREAQAAGAAKLPDLDGFTEYDGIRVAYVGDDGDIYALGWHTRPEAVLHAMDCLARDEAGINGVLDSDEKPKPTDLHRAWAINMGEAPGCEQWCLATFIETDRGTDPLAGRNYTAVTHTDPGAFPVTIFRM